MTSHRVVLFGFLLVVASSAALPATQLEATAKLSAPESILAEPVTLEACLSAALIEEKAVLVSSEMLLSLRMNGPLGPCKKARNIQGYEENPGSLWMLPITLTKESSRWCKQIRLDREFVLQGSGDYTVTIEWLSRAVDAKAKAKALSEIGRNLSGKTAFFAEDFSFLKSLPFRVEAPAGLDRRAYEATHKCPMCNPNLLLKDFPTSTYAGYALAQRTAGLSMEALSCLDDADATLRRWGNRGGGEANTQGHIKEAQDAMRSYAKAAAVFLEAHPDFPQAPLIRRQYIMCLGLTGRMPEAMTQLQTLAQGEGKEATEAKVYLEGKKASSEKKP